MSVQHKFGIDLFDSKLAAVIHANTLALNGIAARVFNGATLIHAAAPAAIR